MTFNCGTDFCPIIGFSRIKGINVHHVQLRSHNKFLTPNTMASRRQEGVEERTAHLVEECEERDEETQIEIERHIHRHIHRHRHRQKDTHRSRHTKGTDRDDR